MGSSRRRSVLTALALTAVILGACGGEATDPTTSPDTPESTVSPLTSTRSPEIVGDEIGTLYVAAYDDVVSLLADRPSPEVAGAELATLKEEYIGLMVGLGYEREALDAAGRAQVDALVIGALNRIAPETFSAYQQALEYYSTDAEVRDLISDFNIIGQYANFDLLREQEPEEAARLRVG